MAAHGFTEAQVKYIERTIGFKTDRQQEDITKITDHAQEAFSQAQNRIEALFVEATQNAGRVDQSVNEINAPKTAIEVKIGEHESGISLSVQAAEAAHARLTVLHVDLKAYAGRTEATIRAIKTTGEVTHAQTMEEFQSFRGNMELWYSGIKSHVEKNVGDGKGKSGGSIDGNGTGRVDQKEIAVWKFPEDLDKQSFRHCVDVVDQQPQLQACELRHERDSPLGD